MRDREDFLRQPRIHPEDHRHSPPFTRTERLLCKTETLELPEIRASELGSIARNRLSRHRSVGRILDFVDDVHQFARMNIHYRRLGPKFQRQFVDIGIEFDAHGPSRVHLRGFDFIRPVDVPQADRLADLPVERHQQVAECEHDGDDEDELQPQRTIRLVRLQAVGRRRHERTLPVSTANGKPINAKPSAPMPIIDHPEPWAAMMPPKNISATDARITAVRRLAARCAVRARFAWVMVVPTLGMASIRIGYLMTGGVAKVWCGGGEDSVHSSPVAPSQTFAEAFSPPRMHFITVYRNSNWVRPKPNAPMLAIMLKSANCSG